MIFAVPFILISGVTSILNSVQSYSESVQKVIQIMLVFVCLMVFPMFEIAKRVTTKEKRKVKKKEK